MLGEMKRSARAAVLGKEHLAPLTGLRYCAAAAVVIAHFCGIWRPGAIPAGNASRLAHLAHVVLLRVVPSLGDVAVAFFFVLSGFILTYTYISPDGRARTTWRDFYVARFARIYPVYMLGLLVAAIPYLRWSTCASGFPGCVQSPRLSVVLSSLTLTQAWWPDTLAFLNGPGWSLSAEGFFYALFPLAVVPLVRLGRRGLLLAGLAFYALLVGPWIVYQLMQPDGPLAHWNWGYHWMMLLWYAPLPRWPEFLLGVVLGRLFVVQRAAGGAAPLPEWMATAAFGLVLVFVYAGLPSLVPNLVFVPFFKDLLTPFIAILIYTVAWQQGRVSALLALPPATILGEASYALYILHWPMWLWVEHYLHLSVAGWAGTGALLVVYLASITALSVLVLYQIEQPARRLIRRGWSSHVRVAPSRVGIAAGPGRGGAGTRRP